MFQNSKKLFLFLFFITGFYCADIAQVQAGTIGGTTTVGGATVGGGINPNTGGARGTINTGTGITGRGTISPNGNVNIRGGVAGVGTGNIFLGRNGAGGNINVLGVRVGVGGNGVTVRGGNGILGGIFGGIFGGGGGGGGGGGKGGGCATPETIGGVIECLRANTGDALSALMGGLAYMMGLIFAYTGIIKFKNHVEDGGRTPLSDGIKRFLAGGALFALPLIIDVVRNTIDGGDLGDSYQNSGFNGASSGVGLDAMIVRLMADIFVPLQWIFGAFGYVAGIALVIIGISRFLKTEQEGPKGPTGIGTIATFVVAGALFSINSIIGFFTATMFNDNVLQTNGVLQYTQGLNGSEAHVHAVISAIIAFSIVLGWVSLIRGFFIMRGVSEGNSQASMMAAITHLIGGVLAVNLGGVIMAVQNTLGIAQYGIVFN